MDKLVERFNHYLDESIASLDMLPPFDKEHRMYLKNRIRILEDVRISFNRIVKKVKDERD